jgi:RNA-binding protein PNO1
MSEECMTDDGVILEHESDLAAEYLSGEKSAAVLAGEDEDMNDEAIPQFNALSAKQMNGGVDGYLRVNVPPHRYTPLKNSWMQIYTPIVEYMKLNIRFDPVKKCIELKTCELTESPLALQKAHDFVKAFCLGFELRDAIALLRLDDLFIDSFEFKDVKILHGEHLSRAIGRVAGHGGKTKFTIENATKTRIVVADTHVHLLGSFQNIRVAKRALCRLIIGSPPGKIYTQMRNVSTRNKQRF